jgi:nitrogen regulatory protein PII-like uncharacterized protein
MNEISDIKGFIDALGGAKAVAALNRVGVTAVYMAVNRGSIPHKWRLPMFEEAKSRKIKFAPSLLGVGGAK